jgi:hypothetical protein
LPSTSKELLRGRDALTEILEAFVVLSHHRCRWYLDRLVRTRGERDPIEGGERGELIEGVRDDALGDRPADSLIMYGTQGTISVIRYWSSSAQHAVRVAPLRWLHAWMRSSTLGTDLTALPHLLS